MGVPEHHGTGGPLATSGALYRDLLARKFLETVTASSYERVLPRSLDFNEPGGRVGAGYYHFNIRDGLRESAAAATIGGTVSGYAPVGGLDVRAGVTVAKLLFDAPSPDTERTVTALLVSTAAWTS